MKRGYIYYGLDKEELITQQQMMWDYCEDSRIDYELCVTSAINNLLNGLEKGDTLVVYDYLSLKMTVLQTKRVLSKLEKLGIKIEYLMLSETERKLVEDIMTLEKDIIRRRTQEGMKTAKGNGKAPGRPSLSVDIQKEIYYLYNTQKLSVREISEKVDVSVGCCHKYTRLKEI